MTGPGPWTTQVGVGVAEGAAVEVTVGVAVAEGAGVEVSVNGIAVGMSLCVGVAGEVPAQPANKQAARIRMKRECIRVLREGISGLYREARSAVQFPDDSQTVESEPRRQDIDDLGLLRHNRGKAAGGNHFHIIA